MANTQRTLKGLNEAELIAKYPHVVPGTLTPVCTDEALGLWKNRVRAKLECGHEHTLFTSDLWQVKACPECKRADKLARKQAYLEFQQRAKELAAEIRAKQQSKA